MKKLLFILCLVVAPVAFAQPKTPANKPSSAAGSFSGKVTETMNTAGYTYVLVDTGTRKVWAAAMEFPVKKGDVVAVAGGMAMPNYHSKTLNRDFDVVYFASSVEVNGKKAAEPKEVFSGHPAPGPKSEGNLPKGHPPLVGAPVDEKIAPLAKPVGGKTVAEILTDKAALNGKVVTVRGKVVKYNGGILGRNWLHIQDGTGTPGSDDLLVTTEAKVALGKTVIVMGKVSLNRDFGSGYKYDVMVEDAKVTIE